jgi:hypothetical protein
VFATKIKSIERTEKLNWEIKKPVGLNLLIAPPSWGKSFLLESIVKLWASQSVGTPAYRVEMSMDDGKMFLLGGKDQSNFSLGLNASIDSGKNGILFYPGNGKRILHPHSSSGYSTKSALAPLSDMKIGLQKSLMLIDDIDCGMDEHSVLEFFYLLNHHAKKTSNQIIATTSRSEIASKMEMDSCHTIQEGWKTFKSSLEELLKVN